MPFARADVDDSPHEFTQKLIDFYLLVPYLHGVTSRPESAKNGPLSALVIHKDTEGQHESSMSAGYNCVDVIARKGVMSRHRRNELVVCTLTDE